MQRPQSDHELRRVNSWTRWIPAALLASGCAVLLAAAPSPDGGDTSRTTNEVQFLIEDLLDFAATSQAAGDGGGAMPFAEAAMYFEENATDGDLGIQFFLDGDEWDRVRIQAPDGTRLVDIRVQGNAGVIGLTEIFSESAEPSFDDLPEDEFLELFPPGEYTLRGRTIKGGMLGGTVNLTHDRPEQPSITSPEEDDVVDADAPLVIEWDSVPDPNAPDSVIESYHVVVEKDVDDEPLRVWTVDMLSTDTSVEVPAGFLEAGKEYKVEILAIETSGNRTITEVPFETDD